MMVHIDDQYMNVSENDSSVTLCWKKETAALTDEGFKGQALKFIDVVKKSKSKKIIVDTRAFSYALSPELIAWRNKNIIAVYNKLGVERFAFISNKPTVPQDDSANTFITRSFLTEEEAREWMRE